MSTEREELHALVDRLDESQVSHVLEFAQQQLPTANQQAMAEWLERAQTLRARLEEKYPHLPSSVDLLNEAREERLDELMGGR